MLVFITAKSGSDYFMSAHPDRISTRPRFKKGDWNEAFFLAASPAEEALLGQAPAQDALKDLNSFLRTEAATGSQGSALLEEKIARIEQDFPSTRFPSGTEVYCITGERYDDWMAHGAPPRDLMRLSLARSSFFSLPLKDGQAGLLSGLARVFGGKRAPAAAATPAQKRIFPQVKNP